MVTVSRVLTEYISDLSPLSKPVIKHMSTQMSKNPEIVVLDELMKHKAKHSDMIEQMVGYLGAPQQRDRLEHSVMLRVEIARKRLP